MLRRLALLAILTSLALVSCADAGDPPDLRMRVRWSLTEPSALPSDVDRISIDVFVGDDTTPDNSIHTVANLEDSDDNGRLDLIRGGLPTNVPIRMRIVGEVGGVPAYVGHVGPIVLRAGERRYVEPAMYRVGASTSVAASGVRGRVLHSATALPDGRVLVAGGFGVSTTACPDGQPEGTRCFALAASDDAYVFDPAEGRFHAVDGGLLAARGGHTATALPDGRVLLAGGASDALMLMTPQGAATSGTYLISIVPGEDASLASFEIFDPELSPEVEDVDADGDPGRGAFVGAADAPTTPGRLDVPRFLATASAIPGTERVLIAGGEGAGASTSFAVFDADRAGGYGVLAAEEDDELAASRVAAGSAGVGSGASAAVWILGGNEARSDADLAEVWSGAADDATGASAPANAEPLLFPQAMAGVAVSRPEWSFVRPIVETVAGGERVVVIGWYGALCEAGTMNPVFAGGAGAVERCGGARRSVTIDVETGLATPGMTNNPHAFGASARLDDGRVIVTGGIGALVWSVNNTVDVLTGTVDATGAAVVSPTPLQLAEGRALHTTTALPEGGALTVGGLRFDASVMNASLPQPEVIYLAAQ
ncbi:kelch repeat-containing protein [Sandaracinus amylolyticus]|uniref:Kelch repeatKelch n=1 Tax=Sandaracinus amylolyticus TaxID=927083 RepID=A0A0F6SFP1_9BACT|nr:kelch repeat-containing protein [Sandaracinus amylolyticus]AKF07284.1 Kelch repeatKelch precursor [Sandaracinus amylolyticus]